MIKAMYGGGPMIDLDTYGYNLVLSLLDFPMPTLVTTMTYANFDYPIDNYVYETMLLASPLPKESDGVFNVKDDVHATIQFNNGMTVSVEAV